MMEGELRQEQRLGENEYGENRESISDKRNALLFFLEETEVWKDRG